MNQRLVKRGSQNSEKKFIGVGELFKKTWRIYKENFWTLIKVTFIPSFLLFLICWIATTHYPLPFSLKWIIFHFFSTILLYNLPINNTVETNLTQTVQLKPQTTTNNNSVINTNEIPSNNDVEEEKQETIVLDKKENKRIITTKKELYKNVLTTENENCNDEKTIASIEKEELTSNVNEETETEIETQVLEKKAFVLGFQISENKGCTPLTVTYSIECDASTEVKVDFGNGTHSKNTSSTITYDKPGIYILNVLATDKSGKCKNISETIEVFSTPVPVAIIDADSDCKENCIVYFYNYSKGVHEYHWDFGDQNYSGLKNPTHYYTKASTKQIKLKVVSENMCADSIYLDAPFSSKSEFSIVFPNAFIPSEGGSNNGQYSLYNYDSDIFYPISKGVIYYKLEIYSRNGQLLFQTTDINQGWDGYYKYQLMPQDVYLWKATGKFENNETFELAGDITLIRK